MLALGFVLHIVVGVLPLAFIVMTSQLIARMPASTGVDTTTGWALLGLTPVLAVLAFALQQVLTPLQAVVTEAVTRAVDGTCIQRLMQCSLENLPIQELERQSVLDILGEARGGFERVSPTPGDAAAGALALTARYAQLFGAAVLVSAVLGMPAGVAVTATAVVVRHGQRSSLGRFGALRLSLGAQRRRMTYIRKTASSADVIKEARLLGLQPWLVDRHHTEARAYLDPLWTGRRRLLFWPFVALAVVALFGGTLTLVVLARHGAAGSLSLLAVSVALQAVLIPLRFGVYFPESDVQTLYGLAAHDALVALEALAARPRPGSRDAMSAERPADDATIRFERVTFRYAPDAAAVLDDIDLEIRGGMSTAIVGLNGAGKTTLVKVLAGLYEPTDGRVLAGDVDVHQLPESLWHRRIAVIFQDFTRYQLTAAENIGLGRPGKLGDLKALHNAARRAGADDVLDELSSGLDTVLSGQYDGGRDLSGGQWQRIALARALLAVDDGASLLILDEPTAQLDVRAEAAFFDRFLELTKGITSVIIAHRFSSVRRADRIVVLDGGRVAESGTHDELLLAGGRYSSMFQLQAERFADDRATLAVGGHE
jgi:ATP-binding cassette subfamily B protein